MATGREIYLTQEGLDDIKKQYRQLVDVERVEVIASSSCNGRLK